MIGSDKIHPRAASLEQAQFILPLPCLSNLSVVILAGGQGKRVGYRQKALMPYQGQSLLSSILQCLTPQGVPIWLNVNADDSQYKAYQLPLFSDNYQGFLGPLAGMQAAWQWVESDWIVFVPCDNPSLPRQLIERLMQTYQQQPAPLIAVHDGERIQPLYLLMHRSMSPMLEKAIKNTHLSVFRWIQENPHSVADFSKENQLFQNLNKIDTS